ncbi:MAG: hypothetical protein ACI3V2_04375 [Faecousia sp.]
MACFLVPMTEAVVVTAAALVMKRNEKKTALQHNSGSSKAVKAVEDAQAGFSRKLMWLAKLLWGGAFLLAYEHVWHGEVVPWFPFLTNAANPEDAAVMLHEMGTIGVTMAVLVTAVWAVVAFATSKIAKRADTPEIEHA